MVNDTVTDVVTDTVVIPGLPPYEYAHVSSPNDPVAACLRFKSAAAAAAERGEESVRSRRPVGGRSHRFIDAANAFSRYSRLLVDCAFVSAPNTGHAEQRRHVLHTAFELRIGMFCPVGGASGRPLTAPVL